jgi:hypothetical protein
MNTEFNLLNSFSGAQVVPSNADMFSQPVLNFINVNDAEPVDTSDAAPTQQDGGEAAEPKRAWPTVEGDEWKKNHKTRSKKLLKDYAQV